MTDQHVRHSVIPAWECYRLMGQQRVGRLAIIEGGYPISIPVSYRLSGTPSQHRIVFRTAPSTTIAQYEGPASLEVDHINEQEKSAWSVIARGALHRLFDDGTVPDPQPWLIEGRDRWLALDVVAVSGRRFVGVPVSGDSGIQWRFE
jgi:Pyridoxamine 5'-phosphate oxidase